MSTNTEHPVASEETKSSTVKLINFDDETVLLAKITKNGVLPPGEYEINVTPVGPSPAGWSCGLCCDVLELK